MYRVGIIINENEASHSKYADTEATLRSAIDACNKNGIKANSYDLITYDKFTIDSLFDTRENDIATLNALIVATNALSFGEKIHNVLSAQRKRIGEFLASRKGIFVSSQKKLSNGNLATKIHQSTGFLPDPFDYYIFDRPESSSAEGSVKILASAALLDYPYKISNELIENRCSNNQFMAHKYRSLIIPKNRNSYQEILCDAESKQISQKELGYFDENRKLLLYSAGSSRIVICTMALDWANHAELLCNILTVITENEPRIFFVKKKVEETKGAIIDSYMIRANIVNIPYREIIQTEIHTCLKSGGNAFIFSPIWSSDEIEQAYASMLQSEQSHFTIHHISSTNVITDKNHKLVKYRNYSSIDVMKDAVVHSLLLSFQANFWGKSVWTYSYVLKLLFFYGVKEPNIVSKLYQELSHHFLRSQPATGKGVQYGDYDGVFNATCKMLEVLNILKTMYGNTVDDQHSFKTNDIILLAEDWINWKVMEGAVFDQDICYYAIYLKQCERIAALDSTIKEILVRLFEQLLTKIAEEILSGRIAGRSSVDLCRIHQTLCFLATEKMAATDNLVAYLTQFESILLGRQDAHGSWKHISETAEITLMLLESHNSRSRIEHELHTINTMIAKGIEALHSQYNGITGMWAEDIGATAKAMNAIGLYDKFFNFSINDFFSDLKLHRESAAELSADLTKERIGYFFKLIDRLETEKANANRNLKESEFVISNIQRKVSRAQYALATIVTLFVGTASLLFLLVFILYTDHREVLFKTLEDWRIVLKDGVVAFIFAVGATELIRRLNKRLKD